MSIFSVAILVAAIVVTSVATFVVTLAVFHYIYIKDLGTLRNGECRCHIFNMVETLFDIK